MSAHIASVIVRAHLRSSDMVAARVAKHRGVEVHAHEGGKIIAVLEAASEAELADQMQALREEPEVLAVSLVFHQVDTEEQPELP
jgi:periplasmic nitrate reductase NapD